VVTPNGAKLPASFLAQDFRGETSFSATGPCLGLGDAANFAEICRAALVDLNRDGRPEIVLMTRDIANIAVLTERDGRWVGAETWLSESPSEVWTAFSANGVTGVASQWDDVMLGGKRVRIAPLAESEAGAAAEATPATPSTAP
jgi:hypothetical protein